SRRRRRRPSSPEASSQAWCRSSASTSASTPWPFAATVWRTGMAQASGCPAPPVSPSATEAAGRSPSARSADAARRRTRFRSTPWCAGTLCRARPARRWSIISTSRASRSAPGRSALLITNRSAISMSPAFIAWIESPDSGTSTTMVVSAAPAMSSSDWPTPIVSTSTWSKPNASSTSATSLVANARPPSEPRDAMERMNTPGSSVASPMRMRSPSSAPPVNGELGSTATTPTVSPRARSAVISAETSVDFPAPGGPVMPMRRARPSRACSAWSSARAPGRSFSTIEIARASAGLLPALKSSSSRASAPPSPVGCVAEPSPMTERWPAGASSVKRLGAQSASHGSGKRGGPALLRPRPLARRPDPPRVAERVLQQVCGDEERDHEHDERDQQAAYEQPDVLERHEDNGADQRGPDRERAEEDAPDLEQDEALAVQHVAGMQPDAELLALGPAQHLAHPLERGPRLVDEPPRDLDRLARGGAEQVAAHAADHAARHFDAVEARVVAEPDALEQGGGAEEVDQLARQEERPGVERVHDLLDHLLHAPGAQLAHALEDVEHLAGGVADFRARDRGVDHAQLVHAVDHAIEVLTAGG